MKSSPPARPLDKALVDELIVERRERFRRLRRDKKHEEYVVLEQDQAEDQAFDADGDGGDKVQKQSSAHMLLRILTTKYIVPLSRATSESDEADTAEQAGGAFGAMDMIRFAKSVLIERPSALEHHFRTQSDAAGFESTVFIVWALPRLVSAAAVLLCRPSAGVKHDALLDLIFLTLDAQLGSRKDNSSVEVVRLVLRELLRTSISALSGVDHPTFHDTLPPPLHLTPRQHLDPSVVFFGDGEYAGKFQAARKPFGNGISGVWMREDHSTFKPDGWDTCPRPLRDELAYALLAITCTITMRSAKQHPEALADMGVTCATLLYSNWKCSQEQEQLPLASLKSNTLSLAIQDQYKLASSFTTITPVVSGRIKLLCRTEASATKHAHDHSIRLNGTPTADLETNLTDLRTIARTGLVSSKRSERLRSGRLIAAIVKRSSKDDAQPEAAERIKTLFRLLAEHMQRSCPPKVRESTLLCVSLLAEVSKHEVQGSALRLLVMALGEENVFLKSLAYTNIVRLATHHRCTTFQLLAPFLEDIAPAVVERMTRSPSLFLEVLQLTKQNQSKFLQATLQFTLPRLIDLDDGNTLQLVAQGIGGGLDVQSMCFSHAPAILLSILLHAKGQRDRSMGVFVKKVRGDNTTSAPEQDAASTLKSMLKGYSVELLGNLVMRLGDVQEVKRKRAFEALQYMDSVLNEKQHKGTRAAASRDILLKQYLKGEILAILSWLNDELMNAHGKRSMAHKAMVTRSVGALIEVIGEPISVVAPQLMATLNTTMQVPELMLPTLESLTQFVKHLDSAQVGPFVGQMATTLLALWPKFGALERRDASSILTEIIVDHDEKFKQHIENDLPDLSSIQKDIPEVWRKVSAMTQRKRPEQRLAHILDRVATENTTVCVQALVELRSFLHFEQTFLEQATSGNAFDSIIGTMIRRLFEAASRVDDDNARDLSLENLSIIGAVDPDRLPQAKQEQSRIILKDFSKDELTDFAVRLIKDVLIGAYTSTHDTKHQSALAYAIQELLKFCGFTAALLHTNVTAELLHAPSPGGGGSVNLKTRQRWNALNKVAGTLAPLLQSKYLVQHADPPLESGPFYLCTANFKEWIQTWTNHLILGINEQEHSSMLFSVFRTVIRDHDLSIAQYILPHLVLCTITLGTEEQVQGIRDEIVAVLQDQIVPDGGGKASERRQLSAQTIFGLLDHLSVWQRHRQRDRSSKPVGAAAGGASEKRGSKRDTVERSLSQMETLMNTISQELMAKASLRCRAYARSLLNYEQRIRALKEKESSDKLQELYEDLHLIYANLDEPDGMEGISSFVLQPSLEHQIREHESTGRWTSAQSCWEVKIQDEPENLDFHVGLLRCLRNLGHYDTMRTHILGVLFKHKDWEESLAPFYIEGCCILSDWEAVRSSLQKNRQRVSSEELQASPQHAMAQVMLAMYDRDQAGFLSATKDARTLLGKPLIASDYVNAYDAVTQLHMLHELSMISTASRAFSPLTTTTNSAAKAAHDHSAELSKTLSIRLESTLPSFRTREPLLSMRRSALNTQTSEASMRNIAGQCWIASSKIARREGHLQTAYSAALQATQAKVPLAFVQHAKLRVAGNDQGQAVLQEIWNSLQATTRPPAAESSQMHSYANAFLFFARLSDASGRRHPNEIIEMYRHCTDLDPHSEKMWYHLGHYYDQLRERSDSSAVPINVGNPLMQDYNTSKAFLKSALFGTKFFYRTIPRVLTIWLDAGDEDKIISAMAASSKKQSATTAASSRRTDDQTFEKINELIRKSIERLAPYQWLAVFPQLVSRVAHRNSSVWKTLQEVISYILTQYPHQAMWNMVAGLQSTDKQRRERFMDIIHHVKTSTKSSIRGDISRIVDSMVKMARELLVLCDCPIKSDEKQLSMKARFPQLLELAKRKEITLPIQRSLSVTMPSTGTADRHYQVFSDDLPRIKNFEDVIEIIPSLQKPRKIVIHGTDGQSRAFLCKPNDDLRKDARLMEFDGMINNLLQSDSASRKRQLYIRTYAVVTLNEECGLIEWVPNTIGLRHILHRLYATRGIALYSQQIKQDLDVARKNPKKGSEVFEKKVLKEFPPVFHEWFVTTFPEPSAWLAARLNYGHTLAVMSMVGWVLGLGDRHGENILFDSISGDTVHVDFNCLFERGATFEIPERVPFRLTQNLVDALGVTGVEGVFRKAAEVSMSVLRDHKDSLMSVLEAMVHDPLGEWGIDNRAQTAKGRSSSTVRVDPRTVEARKSLDPVSRRLMGHLRRANVNGVADQGGAFILSSDWTPAYTTNRLVDALIRDATSTALLSQMYVGWAPYL